MVSRSSWSLMPDDGNLYGLPASFYERGLRIAIRIAGIGGSISSSAYWSFGLSLCAGLRLRWRGLSSGLPRALGALGSNWSRLLPRSNLLLYLRSRIFLGRLSWLRRGIQDRVEWARETFLYQPCLQWGDSKWGLIQSRHFYTAGDSPSSLQYSSHVLS